MTYPQAWTKLGLMNDLTPKDIIAWFRAKAKQFNTIADQMETTFGADGQAAPSKNKQRPELNPGSSPKSVLGGGGVPFKRNSKRVAPKEEFHLESLDANAANIKQVVRKKSKRIAELSSIFQVPEEKIQAIIDDPDSGLMMVERGWIKLSEPD